MTTDDIRKLDINPKALFTSTNCIDGVLMRCPLCQCPNTYTHPIGACTRIGSDYGEASVYRGTDAIGVTGERRSALVVIFRCESGHRFALVIQQCKGENFCWIEQWPGVEQWPDDMSHDDLVRHIAERFADVWFNGAIDAQKRMHELQADRNAHAVARDLERDYRFALTRSEE